MAVEVTPPPFGLQQFDGVTHAQGTGLCLVDEVLPEINLSGVVSIASVTRKC